MIYNKKTHHIVQFIKNSSLLFAFIVCTTLQLKSQHQIITTKGDTLNCYQIDQNYEIHIVNCYDATSDSTYTIYENDIILISYNHYSPYPNIRRPLFAINPEFGLSLAQYEQAFGNLETQTLLKDSFKRGIYLSFNLHFFNRKPFGLAAQYSYSRFNDYLDSTKAKENFHTMGLGAAFGGANITKQIFLTGHIIITYSKYNTKGNLSSFHFSEKNSFWGLQLSPNINFHLLESTLLRFGITLNILSKPPSEAKDIFKPVIGHINFGLGFVQFI